MNKEANKTVRLTGMLACAMYSIIRILTNWYLQYVHLRNNGIFGLQKTLWVVDGIQEIKL